jgi:hypothetical protein
MTGRTILLNDLGEQRNEASRIRVYRAIDAEASVGLPVPPVA